MAGPGDPLWEAAAAALVEDRSRFAGDWFLGVHNPPLRLVVVGAVHIAQALVPMARLAGYDVTVIDPREAFASEARFPARVQHRPDEALARSGLDVTAVVTLTRDPSSTIRRRSRRWLRRLSISAASDRSAPTPGGSRSCGAAGEAETALTRIHAPIGADIGASSPAEIAVATSPS